MRGLVLMALVSFGVAGVGAAGLDELKSALLPLRKPAPPSDNRGATAELTVAKHHLRDWIESRLHELPLRDDGRSLERKLNDELRSAGLFCGEEATSPCPEMTNAGFLSPVKLRWSQQFLIVVTSLGIVCGYDDSAYVYAHSAEGWGRVWQTEQTNYAAKAYRPQVIQEVLVSPYSPANDYLVMTLGTESWCSSLWHPAYYRVFRMGPDPDARPLVDGAERSYLDRGPQGSVTSTEALVEFAVGSIDTAVHNRPAIRHYRIEGETVERVDPLALSPRDFVDEWLTHQWREAAFWSESANRLSVASIHRGLHKDSVLGEFVYPTRRCGSRPDLWQVGVDFTRASAPAGTQPDITYFLIRWQPPYRFRMVDARKQPFPGCTKDAPEADERRTLFPEKDWR